MGKRGYLTVSAIVLSVLMVLFVGIILRPLTGSGLLLRQHLEGVSQHYERLSALERVCAVLEDDMYFTGECNYADIGQVITVTLVEERVEEGITERIVKLSTGQRLRIKSGERCNIL